MQDMSLSFFDENNTELQNAYRMIADTNQSIFLTGRAGTGKTTFLKAVVENVDKRFVVLAPTGIAAINVDGVTIHSFFGFDFGVQGPASVSDVNTESICIIRKLDTIIIDEVSMVRCDIIDAIDRSLRRWRKTSEPFGGVQMVFVGDLFQLPPVAKNDAADYLYSIYGTRSFYFYNAKVFANLTLPKIELEKVYRQTDPEYIGILDRFRMGRVTSHDLDIINSRVENDAYLDDDLTLTLTSYNKDADLINKTQLDELGGKTFLYDAIITGKVRNFDGVAELLALKKDAQVMFTKNDSEGHRWVNGTIGRIIDISEDNITVKLKDGEQYSVERTTWDCFQYSYNPDTEKYERVVVGSVTQFPLRLAWAITIHKSQSLTFDKVKIDFGRFAFADGMAYVALSRCRSLEGLILLKPVTFKSVRVSDNVLEFATTFNDARIIENELTVGEALSEYQKRNDYDGAAVRLYDMACAKAEAGDTMCAYDWMNRSLSWLADDECLMGHPWKKLPNKDKYSIVLNAIGLFYSGRTDESLRLLRNIVGTQGDNFNAVYLKARCVEQKGLWNEVQSLYERMDGARKEAEDNGMDSTTYRKLKYRQALLSDKLYGSFDLKPLCRLIAENPYYDKYHILARHIILNNVGKTGLGDMKDNPLVASMMDARTTDSVFVAKLAKERAERTGEWSRYKSFICNVRVVSQALRSDC